MARNVKISVISQPTIQLPDSSDPEKQVQQMWNYLRGHIEQVLPDKPDLIVLPEACDRFLGMSFAERKAYYRYRGNRIRDMLSDLAREQKCYIAYSAIRYLPEEESSGLPFRNSTQIIDRSGNVVGIYDKNHIMPRELELADVAYGTQAPVFDLDFGRVCCAICFDLNYLELMQRYSVQKPELILFQSMYHGGFVQKEWAYNCRAYFASAVADDLSNILSPLGSTVATTTNYVRHVTKTINLDYVMAHFDDNWEKFDAAKQKYGSLLRLEEPGHVGSLIMTYEGHDTTATDIAKEFGIVLLDDYLDLCRAHRREHA